MKRGTALSETIHVNIIKVGECREQSTKWEGAKGGGAGLLRRVPVSVSDFCFCIPPPPSPIAYISYC